MHRRLFLQSALGASGAALTGCSIPADDVERDAEACTRLSGDADILRIDMHCHLLNQDDANGAAFLVRRFAPQTSAVGLAAGGVIRTAVATAALGTDSLEVEREKLAGWFRKPFDSRTFCRNSHSDQRGVFLSGDAGSQQAIGAGRPIGFASSRLRNAAIMMTFWPEVDVFMPSMVDVFEGRGDAEGRHPVEQAEFYRDLHLATRGRFLPLVSYNPARQVKEGRRFLDMKALDLVERAIEEWGFVGVKVHPSAGFNPVDNAQYGCPNTALQRRERLSPLEAIAYDRAMEALYRLCERLDAPILTHGSDSLSAHVECMQGTTDPDADPRNARYSADPLKTAAWRDPATWTNAPQHWGEMLRRNAERERLRVCIAHYGSRFQNHLAAKPLYAEQVRRDARYDPTPGTTEPRPYHDRPEVLPPVEYDADGALVPSEWLQGAIDRIEGGERRMWIDLSHMSALCYSEAARRGERIVRTGIAPSAIDDQGRYALAFRQHLAAHPALHGRLMYGTDWHMPEVSVIGPSYRRLIEGVLPPDAREDIMGANAARFFGLARRADGSVPQTRQRLEAFYTAHDIDLDEVRWRKRLKVRMGG